MIKLADAAFEVLQRLNSVAFLERNPEISVEGDFDKARFRAKNEALMAEIKRIASVCLDPANLQMACDVGDLEVGWVARPKLK